MFHVTVIMEDTTIVATQKMVKPEGIDPPSHPLSLNVTVADNVTGKTRTCEMTFEQFTATFALGFGSVGENDTPGYNKDVLYSQVEPIFCDWPNELRPIP